MMCLFGLKKRRLSIGIVNLQLHKRKEKSYPECLLWTKQEIRPLNWSKRRCQLESTKLLFVYLF